MASNPVVANLLALKEALQDLESAVQEPREDTYSVDHVNERFPPVFELFHDTLSMLLRHFDAYVDSPEAVVRQSHERGWLRGDLALWLHMASDYECLNQSRCQTMLAQAVCQDVRACTYVFWETYELLMAKFRWQTQVAR